MELTMALTMSLALLVLSAAYVLVALRRSRSSSSKPRRLPPSPPGWPVIGHLHLMSGMPHHALAELARTMRAPLFRMRLGSVPAVVISKPDLARAALTTNDAALASRPHLLSGQFLSFGCSDVTFAPAGPYHRMARRVVVSELLSARRVATYGAVRVKELRRLLAHLTKNTSPAKPVDLSECFLNLANDVLCRVAFGRRFPHGEGDKLGAVLAEAQDLFAGFTIGDFFPELEPVASTVTGLRRRLKKCLADLREACDVIVDEHISGNRQRIPGDRDEDFVDVLLRVQKSPDLEVPLTDDNLKALVLDMFVAGTDTTFATLEWVMTELVRHPRILKKAQEEVRRVVGDSGRVEESHLGELHYMRAIIKETFRLHPAVPLLVPRESVAPCTLGGYDIPARTRVFINTFAMGRDPEIWDNPLEYSPERFESAGGGGEIDLKDPDYKLLPFGGGRRGCPGYTFALATVQVSLASLLYHFEWALPAGVRAEDVNLDETFGLATRKKEPLFVAVRKSEAYEFKGEELSEV
ncbi:tryptamine 5-hydroxylase [Oryza glaberrima]|uniref:Cytochrome P450 n=1 Tax=Oryza glaberrima TaxID=4538 RepID=I1R5F5_ORYGL|nr:tryptamine 5-hydroxylase [Oryza glaberrima]